MSSADASRRLKRKHEELARAGRLAGYGKRSFGFRFNHELRQLEVVEDEATELRAAARRIIHEGATVRTVLKDWVERGIHAPGGRWQQTNFRTMLTSARIAGQREYGGTLTMGNWPAIISVDELRQLRARLNGNHVATARSYLLSGFCRCGVCGHRMVSRPSSRAVRRYVCARAVDGDNCGTVARQAQPIEALVKEAVLIALDGVDLREYVTKPGDGCEDVPGLIATDEERLKELATDYADGAITKPEWYAARDHLNGRLEANRKRLSKANGSVALASFVGAGEEVRRQWDERGLDWQRAVISAVVDHVVIEPAVKGDKRFNPELVRIQWKF